MFQFSYLILHLAMIAAGTYFMADMANLTLASQLESQLDTPNKENTTLPLDQTPLSQNSHSNYHVIVKKNIFNSESTQGAPKVTHATQEIVPQVVSNLPPLNLELIGTAIPNGGVALAIIKDPKEKEQMLYRKGEIIGAFSGGDPGIKPKIIEIHRNKIVLLRGGTKEVLEVTDKPKKKNPGTKRARGRSNSPPPQTTSTGTTSRQVSKGQWVLDRRELDDALKNLPQLLTKARVIPSFKDGQPDGFRIFAIAKDSLYAKIGLQNGDILHRINGVDVKSPQNFMKVIEQLKDESRISVDLVRNNQKDTFSYDIR